MTQHNLDLDPSLNQTGLQFETDCENALKAVVSCSSGASEPSTKYPNQLWADTTNNLMKQRDNANTVWIIIGVLGSANHGLAADLNANSTGSPNAYAVTVSGLFSLAAGVRVFFHSNFTNTGAPTLSVNGGSALGIYKFAPSGPLVLQAGDILTASWVGVMYDGANWLLITPVSAWDYTSVPAACGYFNSTWAFSASGWWPVAFDSKAYDNQTEFDVVSNKGRYTAKFPGIYSVKASLGVAYTSAASKKIILSVLKGGVGFNGAPYGPQIYEHSTTTLIYGWLSGDVKLAANEYIELAVWCDGASPVVQAGGSSWVQITKVA